MFFINLCNSITHIEDTCAYTYAYEIHTEADADADTDTYAYVA